MLLTPFERAGIQKAPDCPHYITARRAAAIEATIAQATADGGKLIPHIRRTCVPCATRPVQVFGMYDQSGPMRTRKYYSHAKCTHAATTRARERCRAEMAAAR